MFYKEYFKFKTTDESTSYKINYLNKIIKDNKIYKFIQFGNEEENELKINSFENNSLWFSFFRWLNDPTEFEINFDIEYITRNLNISNYDIKSKISMIQNLYDICSFSYVNNKYMWKNYACSGNGMCLVFEPNNLDMLYPVDYIDKKKIPFDKLFVDSINKLSNENIKDKNGKMINDPMSILPYVLKYPLNGSLDSTKENELRILYSPFDFRELNNGYIYPNIKDKLNYYGINVSYEKLELTLKDVIIGNKVNKNLYKRITKTCIEKKYNIIDYLF